jgi:hypothetical protein
MNISLAALPDVKWSNEAKTSIEILSHGPKIESLRECVGKGFSLENKFEVRICKPRSLWFDKCEDVLVLVKQISRDPISGKLSLLQDTLGDGEDPEERSVVSETNALESLRNSGVVPVQIGDGNLSVRVTETCKGSYSSTVRRISRILSFGVIEFRGDTSGWVEFK